ncbi:MAG: MFS transporter [Chloroflexi bacterium]|nr:MFS transporter [Chloroflexota bacterium]
MRAAVPPYSQAELGRYHWVVLASLGLILGTTILVRDGIGVLAPFLQADLQISRAEFGLYLSVVSLGSMFSSLPFGHLADTFGTRWILASGSFILGALFVIFGWIPSWGQGLAIAFLVGLLFGSIPSVTTKAVLDWFPMRVRATAMAIKQTGLPLGITLAGLTMPALALALSWRHAVAVEGVAIMVSAVVLFLVYRDPSDSSRVALSPGGGWRALRDLLGNRDIAFLNLAMATSVAVQYGFTAYWVLYLNQYHALSAVAAGGYFALAQFTNAFGRIGWGVASDRLFAGSRRAPLAIIAFLTAGIIGGFASLTPGASEWVLAAGSALFGLVSLPWGSLAITLLSELAGREHVGTAAGLGSTVNGIGLALGPVLFGYIVDQTGSYRWGWLFLAFCSIVAFLLFLSVREENRKA